MTEDINIKSHTGSLLLVLLVCGLMFYLGYRWDILPLRNQLIADKLEETRLKQEMKELFYKQISLEERVVRVYELEAILNAWQKTFIKSIDLLKLKKEISKIGREDQLQFQFFDVGAEEQDHGYLKVPFKVMIVGDYVQTAHFVSQIAALPWMVLVGDFNMVKVDPFDTSSRLTTQVMLDVYYLEKKGRRSVV